MNSVLDHPLLLFALSFVTLWLSTRVGASVLRRRRSLEQDSRDDFDTVLLATLTLNALIIGFSFSMAASRYDQRKSYEATEANAIGTEYLRADLLPAPEAAKVRSLLSNYLEQRISFYKDRGERGDTRNAQLQAALWATVRGAASAQPTPTVALVVAGMNDVLNSQAYTQAAWWNRIPRAAWILMVAIAIIGNLLVGYGVQNVKAESLLLIVVPCVLSISFLLIADIDCPQGGLIRVNPQSLTSLAASLSGS
jgi:hypothetical protein